MSYTNGDENREKEYLRSLDVKGVDGLIYISGMKDIPSNCLKRKIPMVCIDRNPHNTNENIVIVQSDNYNGGLLATEELIKKGCTDILILKSFKDHSSNKQRFEGYKDALKKHSLPIKEQLILDINTSFEDARKAVNDFIKKDIKFDGIFAVNDRTALGSLVSLKENKIKVPQQVKIVGFDNIFISQHSNPAITTINQDKLKLAQEASKVLLELINDEFIGEHHVILPVSLVKRGTT